MDGIPWAPDPSEAMDSMSVISMEEKEAMDSMDSMLSMGNVYQSQTVQVAVAQPASQPIETVIMMHNLDHSQTGEALISMDSQPLDGLASQSQTMESMEVNSRPTQEMNQPGVTDSRGEVTDSRGEVTDSRGEVTDSRSEVVLPKESIHLHSTTNDDQKEVHGADPTPRTPLIQTPEPVIEEVQLPVIQESSITMKDVDMEANQYFVPCGEAFDLSQLCVQNSQEKQVERNETLQERSSPVMSEGVVVHEFASNIISTSEYENSEHEDVPQMEALNGEIDKIVERLEVETEGGHKLQGYLVMGQDGSQYVMSSSTSPTIEEQMRAIHGPTPSPVLGLGGNQVEQHQADIKSPEETATVIMDEMIKDIFSGGDEETGIEDAEVANIMENNDNNFVNVSQFVVNQSFPLKFDPLTGEMVPDIETEQDENIEKLQKIKSRTVAKIKPKNVAKVKPLPPITPLQMTTILSSTATHSSAPRNVSESKCSCSKHIVLGYPPSAVVYWQVHTTPGIRKTIMDFDNEGVKFLYDDGSLKALQTVLSSVKSDSEEKSLEVSLCLSCVRWAEGEVKETNQSKSPKKVASPKKESFDKDADSEVKKRKRGRPPTPEESKKIKTTPEVPKKMRTLSTENVYKKNYNSRRSSSVVEEPKKEETKNSKVMMYDLYCDIPGCNARLRGYPSLIKHFKSKHPEDSVTPDETSNLESSKDESVENLIDDDEKKYLTIVKDPSKKLKAMEDMSLLYIKVEKLKDYTLPLDYVVNNSGEVHPKKILGNRPRKSVEFKRDESLVDILTISPRRKHETRRLLKENLDLNSPLKPKIVKLDLSNPKPVDAKSKEQPNEVASSDSTSPRSQMVKRGRPLKVQNLITPEIATNKPPEEAPSSQLQAPKENIKLPKVMLEVLTNSPSTMKEVIMSPSPVVKKQKEIDKLRIDMVPEVVSPMQQSRSKRSDVENSPLKPKIVKLDLSNPKPVEAKSKEQPNEVASSDSTSPRSQIIKRGRPLKVPNLITPEIATNEQPEEAPSSQLQAPKENIKLPKVMLEILTNRPSTMKEVIMSPSPVVKKQKEIDKLRIDMVPEVVSPMRQSRSKRSDAKDSPALKSTSSPIRVNRSAVGESKNVSDFKKVVKGSPRLDKLRIDMVPGAVSPMRASRSARTESENPPKLKKQDAKTKSPNPGSQSKDISSMASSRSGRAESKRVAETENELSSGSSTSEKSPLDKLRIDMVPGAISPRRESRSTKTTPKDLPKPKTPKEPIRTEPIDLITRKTRHSLHLEEQKSPNKSFGQIEGISPRTKSALAVKNKDNKTEQIRKRGNNDAEIEASEPLAKVTRSGKVVSDVKPQQNKNDIKKIFADLDIGTITISQAAKVQGIEFAQMQKLYREYKINNIKIKVKKLSNSSREKVSVEPLQEETDIIEPSEEVINTVEPSEGAVGHNSVPKNLQDSTSGFKKIKEELLTQLSLEGPLSKDNKKLLLEMAGAINMALLKDL